MIFVEDSKTVPIGHVLKVDGAYAFVHFKSGVQGLPKDEDVSAVMEESRLLRIDDLQAIKNGSLPKTPDCLQKSPKRVALPDLPNILGLSADAAGIQAVVREGKKVLYKSYNLHSGRVEKESRFPIDMAAFLGLDPSLVSLHSGGTGDVEQMNVLRDGNGTLFPLVKDALETLKDPILLDLPPVKCLGLGVHALPHVGPTQKNQVGVLVLALEQQVLMGKILKCEVEGIRTVLSSLDAEFQNRSGGLTLNRILLERADGNRNIFHVSVSMAVPTLNKETDAPLATNTRNPFLAVVPNNGEAHEVGPSSAAPRTEPVSSTNNGAAANLSSRRGEPEDIYITTSSQPSSVPLLDAEDSNESLDSAHALNMGFKAFGSGASGQSGNIATPMISAVWDPSERIRCAQQGLKLLLGSVALEPHLHQFLGER